jgi:hypothetical protein
LQDTNFGKLAKEMAKVKLVLHKHSYKHSINLSNLGQITSYVLNPYNTLIHSFLGPVV